jgi:hypothetical protein
MSYIKDKIEELNKYSDFHTAQEKAFKYLGDDAILFYSPNERKKYRIYVPNTNKWVDFGQMGYEDFTRHKDENRRRRYLARATKMKGDWKENPYSPNNLSINILW